MAAGQVITKPKYMPLPRLINTIITHSGTLTEEKKKKTENLGIKITKNSMYRRDSIMEGRRNMHSGKISRVFPFKSNLRLIIFDHLRQSEFAGCVLVE